MYKEKSIFDDCWSLYAFKMIATKLTVRTLTSTPRRNSKLSVGGLKKIFFWLNDSPPENNGHHYASSGSVKTYWHRLLLRNYPTWAQTLSQKKKKNTNQFCILARLRVSFPLFSTSAPGLGQMSQRGFVYL